MFRGSRLSLLYDKYYKLVYQFVIRVGVMGSDVVVIRVPRELKERMRKAEINWSEEIRNFIEGRLRSYELRQLLREVRKKARLRKVSVDSTKLIRGDRDQR